jgi:phage gp16-like protein
MMPKPRVQGVGAMRQKRLPLTTGRAAMLAKVHVAKKQLGLDDAAYRDVVTRITGTDSSAAASDAALHRLLAEFARLGFRATRPVRRSDKPNVRLIAALWADLAPYVDDPSAEALRAFVRRQTHTRMHPDGMDAPEFLDGVQANRVIEGLKAWLARAQHKGASA